MGPVRHVRRAERVQVVRLLRNGETLACEQAERERNEARRAVASASNSLNAALGATVADPKRA